MKLFKIKMRFLRSLRCLAFLFVTLGYFIPFRALNLDLLFSVHYVRQLQPLDNQSLRNIVWGKEYIFHCCDVAAPPIETLFA
jgi:hypothetical protein